MNTSLFIALRNVAAIAAALVRPAVQRLLSPAGPLAVLGRVATRIVDPVDGVVGGRLLSHVEKEVLERVSPPIADRDANSSVGVVARVLRLVAALAHRHPALPLPGVCASVGGVPLRHPATAVAPAGLSVAAGEVGRLDHDLRAAVAPAEPVAGVAVEVVELQDGEVVVDVAGSVDTRASHSGLLRRLVMVRAVPALNRRDGPFAFWSVAPAVGV